MEISKNTFCALSFENNDVIGLKVISLFDSVQFDENVAKHQRIIKQYENAAKHQRITKK